MTLEFLGLKSRKTGDVARLRMEDGDSSQRCFLTKDPTCPYFQAQSLAQLERVLLADTPWYNATAEKPGWGDFEGVDLVPVKVRVTVELEDVEMPPVFRAKTVDTRDIHAKVAKRYAGRELVTDGDGAIVFWLVERPWGLTVEEMQDWVGQHAYSIGDVWTRRKVYAVCEVPEEFVPDLKGRPGALLLASENRYA